MDEGFKGTRGGTRGGTICKADEKYNFKEMKCVKKNKQETRLSYIFLLIVILIMIIELIISKLWYLLIFILIILIIFMIYNYNSIKNSLS
jgi:uncharacterized membrane protein